MNRVNFQEFYDWRQRYYSLPPNGIRLGQAFCNYFAKEIGRGDHTLKLFYSEDNMVSEKIIYENFIEFNENFYS